MRKSLKKYQTERTREGPRAQRDPLPKHDFSGRDLILKDYLRISDLTIGGEFTSQKGRISGRHIIRLIIRMTSPTFISIKRRSTIHNRRHKIFKKNCLWSKRKFITHLISKTQNSLPTYLPLLQIDGPNQKWKRDSKILI